MTTEISNRQATATPEEAARMTASWPDLLHSPIQTTTQADQISAGVKRLTEPAAKKWIAGRVATVLSQYFASSVPAEMMTAIAEDWHEELSAFPAWALQKAFRWWMGEGNEKRRQKPLPGDIAARARVEMGAVKVAESALRRFRQGVDAVRFEPEPQPERVSKDAAARILEEAGFTAKRFGGDA